VIIMAKIFLLFLILLIPFEVMGESLFFSQILKIKDGQD